MTIEQLPSKSYRISEMRNGVRVRITVNHKPTQKEAKELIEEKLGIVNNKTHFKRAADIYIESKSNILSPSSIRGYRSIVGHLP